ncbi:hypothetical protein SLS62_002979 [Diatrype stigma]|uniref:Uncharacterized protein n=1 Tax=Diatrype stigma TaxID=117547 RepID=A0AAN9YUT9_9PEZI
MAGDNHTMDPAMEKQRSAWSASSHAVPRGNNRWLLWKIAILLGSWWMLAQYTGLFHRGNTNHGLGNDTVTASGAGWADITPSEKLVWHPCGYPYLCARLTVPMDYHRPLNESADNPKVHLALLMVPGAGRNTDPASFSESPMLLNPGGPGGSGVSFAQQGGQLIQGVVGNHHDIIGFDPRGVGATTPSTNCFAAPDDPQGLNGNNIALINRLSWITSGHDVGIVNSSNVALSKIDVRARALGQLCKKVDDFEGENSIFRYANTANVARDMLSIVDAWDEWRATSETPESQKPRQESSADGTSTHDEQASVDPTLSTKGKLVYWGFSYGTLLGATFAAMFPDRVGRVILDGVVDADHYVGPTWIDSLIDTDAIWDQFFADCHEAGSDCKFFRPGDEVEDIRGRFYALMDQLQKQPAIAISPAPDANLPVLITASDLKAIVFSTLYAPITAFPGLATLLDVILEGHLDQIAGSPVIPQLCHNIDLPIWPTDAQAAVMCSDKRYKVRGRQTMLKVPTDENNSNGCQLNEDVPALQGLFEKMASYSSFADVWLGLMLGCNGWEIESKDPPMRWDDHPSRKPAPIGTAFPLLFLSSRRDPVTPLHAALKMTRKFANASIVEQVSDGHCTISCISACTVGHVRAYVNSGVLPPAPKFDDDDGGEGGDGGEWATCECDEKPWKKKTATTAAAFDALEAEEEEGGSSSSVAHLGVVNAEADDDADEHTLEEEMVEVMASYHDLRNHFVSQMVSQLVDEFNPLRQFIVDMPLHAAGKPQKCSKGSQHGSRMSY